MEIDHPSLSRKHCTIASRHPCSGCGSLPLFQAVKTHAGGQLASDPQDTVKATPQACHPVIFGSLGSSPVRGLIGDLPPKRDQNQRTGPLE